MNTTTDPYPDVPLPAGADEVYGWDDPGTPHAFRQFTACHRVIDFDLGENFSRPWTTDFEVRIEGIQYPDGRIRREILAAQAGYADNPMTIDQAEQFAAALLEATKAARAADAIDGLSDPEGTIAP
jgi:hypothetical protein